jgi:hypothetical protein
MGILFDLFRTRGFSTPLVGLMQASTTILAATLLGAAANDLALS